MPGNGTSKDHLAAIVKVFERILEQKVVQDWLHRMLEEAPTHLAAWAAAQRRKWKERPTPNWVRPNYHFGQEKLERRVEQLRTNLTTVFPAVDDPGRRDLIAAAEQIETAISVAERLPVLKRKQAQFRIDKALDEMERALFRSVLPKIPSTST